jgi:hypothetical protein
VFWNHYPASEKCLPKGPTLGITYALAAVNAAADWAFGTLPIFIVWDLEMKFRTKVMVAGILAFAAIGSTGTIVRMFYIKTLMDGPDFLYSTVDVALWYNSRLPRMFATTVPRLALAFRHRRTTSFFTDPHISKLQQWTEAQRPPWISTKLESL